MEVSSDLRDPWWSWWLWRWSGAAPPPLSCRTPGRRRRRWNGPSGGRCDCWYGRIAWNSKHNLSNWKTKRRKLKCSMDNRMKQFQQLADPKPELENIVYSDSRLKKRFFVFLGRFAPVRLQSLQKVLIWLKKLFFLIISIWVPKNAECLFFIFL